MKAITYSRYGSPDVLELVNINKPTPKENEVLVKIHAAATNPLDWHLMRASPFLARMANGYLKPRNHGIGADLAGTVEAVGAGVTRFKVGDAVFGSVGAQSPVSGAFAEYAAVAEKGLVAKPANVTFEGAASTPIVGVTAIQGLRDAGQIKAGQRVLINGASGGIGTFAVQYAKSVGAHVTGVCSGRNAELVKSLGADAVIDYTKVDFTRSGQQYDLIFDTIGNITARGGRRALKPSGIGVVAGFTTIFHVLFRLTLMESLLKRFDQGKSYGMMGTARVATGDLQLIAELLESGAVKPVIEKSYPLTQTADAIRHLETGRVRGKVMVTVAGER